MNAQPARSMSLSPYREEEVEGEEEVDYEPYDPLDDEELRPTRAETRGEQRGSKPNMRLLGPLRMPKNTEGNSLTTDSEPQAQHTRISFNKEMGNPDADKDGEPDEDELAEALAINDPAARKFALRQLLKASKAVAAKEATEASIAGFRQGAQGTTRAVAKEPSVFDGTDKRLKFKQWTQTLQNYLEIKGQDESSYVSSAMTFLGGLPSNQASLLLHEKPAKEWGFVEWVEAMQDALVQIDPVHEARLKIHTAKLDKDENFNLFSQDFQSNLAVVNSSPDKMSSADALIRFRMALKGTMYSQHTEYNPVTRKPFKSLSDVLTVCRSLFQSRFPEGARGPVTPSQGHNGQGFGKGTRGYEQGPKRKFTTVPGPERSARVVTVGGERTPSIKKPRPMFRPFAGAVEGASTSFAEQQREPRCYRCKQIGHVRKDCPMPATQQKDNAKPKRNIGQAVKFLRETLQMALLACVGQLKYFTKGLRLALATIPVSIR